MQTKRYTVNAKGQVVIPAEIRTRVGIRAGTKLVIFERDGEVVIRPMDAYIASLKGAFKVPGKSMVKDLLAERKKDWRG